MKDDVLDAALRDAAAGPRLPPMSDALRAELEDTAPVTPRRPRRQLAVAAVVSGAWVVGLLVVLGLRRDLEPLPRLWLSIYLAAWAAGFALLLAGATVPPHAQVMPRSPLFGRLGIAIGIAFVVAGLALARQVPGLSTSYDPSLGNVLSYGYYCVAIGLLVAGVPILLLGFLGRGVAPTGAAWLGFAVGAAGGSLGGLTLHLHCPITEPTHLGLVHGGVILIAGALGAAAFPRLARL
jgi:hypothetical protein